MPKKIEWLTKEYIAQQARKSRKAALQCSCEHWRQLFEAGPKTLVCAFRTNLVSISSVHCSLCQRYYGCRWCLFASKGCGPNNVWGKAANAFKIYFDNTTKANWTRWREAAEAVYKSLLKIYKELYPNE